MPASNSGAGIDVLHKIYNKQQKEEKHMKTKQSISLLLCFIMIAVLLTTAFAEEIQEPALEPEEDPLLEGFYYLDHIEITGYECIDGSSHYRYYTEYWYYSTT